MTLKDKIRDTIRLSIASQLFLLKHKEVGDALKDIDNLTSQLLSAIQESLPKEKTHWIQHGDIGHTHETEEDSGYNQALKEIKEILK